MGKNEEEKRISAVLRILDELYPEARTALHFTSPLELLVAAILSAQCTDERVNQVTQDLFRKYRSAEEFAKADRKRLEEDIRPTGFFRNKAKALQECSAGLVERFDGRVPKALEDLVSLPGIGRKTANLVLGEAFGIPGIVVDTHVGRLSRRIGLTQKKDPVKVEFDLMEIVPKKRWTRFSNQLILHGRTICTAKNPMHQDCRLVDHCEEGLSWKRR